MKQTMKRAGALLVLTGLLVTSTTAVPGSPPTAAAKKAKKVSLSKTKATLKQGKTLTLTLKQVPKKDKKKVKWSSSDKTVATVKAKKNTRKATVTAVTGGAVTITAKYKKKTYKCRVTCQATEPTRSDPTPVPDTTPDPSATSEPGTSPDPSVTPAATYTSITQSEALRMMQKEDGHVIVDVRRLSEYTAKHITGAILIPNESITTEMPEKLPDLDQIILVYCRSGRRSKEAAQKLADIGYTHVYEFGGINTWVGPVVG
ncbi:MAG: rhodanese-like domain-containing protein [Eubacterium sp.]|nr:rhodanese-like domain-containing protein [Eubacterium sp.]